MRQLQPSQREYEEALADMRRELAPWDAAAAELIMRSVPRYVLTGPTFLMDTTPVELTPLPYDTPVQKRLDLINKERDAIVEKYKKRFE